MNGLKVVIDVNKDSSGLVHFEGNILGFPEDLRGDGNIHEVTNGKILSMSYPQLVIDLPNIALFVWGDSVRKDNIKIYQEGEFSDFEVGKILDTFYDLVTSFNESIGSSERPVINTWKGLG